MKLRKGENDDTNYACPSTFNGGMGGFVARTIWGRL